ncbi:MAG: hypothetical protein LBE61_09735 [Burkholderiaceae bacterium]|jgi:hypothetical protein|nr:hypothetical protein [Burkholderiaceae bacterium]
MSTSTSNTAKYLSYTAAWDRINQAQANGYSFEVVTLCEGIISDRLLSFVLGVDPDSGVSERTPFDKLIRLWGSNVSPPPLTEQGDDLITKVDEWRKQRNTVLHGMVKSMPTQPTEAVASFTQRATDAATEGICLAKAVQSWHKKQLPK